MASLIWLNIKECGRLIDDPSANISSNKPYNNRSYLPVSGVI